MKRYRLTERAVSDMRSIGRFTAARWGTDQRNAYLRRLGARFIWLSENPRLGRHRPEINPRYFSFPEGEHLIFYRLDDEIVEVIGILHKSMDIAARLGSLPG